MKKYLLTIFATVLCICLVLSAVPTFAISVSADLSHCEDPTCTWQFGDGNSTTGCGAQDYSYSDTGTYNATFSVDCGAFSQEVTRQVSVGGTNALASCQDHLDAGHTESGVYKIDPDGEGGQEPFRVYCNQQTEDGGWTLVGTIADDGNDYWTWNNMWNKGWIYGHEHGDVDGSPLSSDFQSKAWAALEGDEILINHSSKDSKYLVYDGVISGQSLGFRYPSSKRNVGEFTPNVTSGSWWQQCGDSLHMSLMHKDTDPSTEWSVGFVWRSKHNNSCDYDDAYGGINGHGVYADESREYKWDIDYFFFRNFDNVAMNIFVR